MMRILNLEEAVVEIKANSAAMHADNYRRIKWWVIFLGVVNMVSKVVLHWLMGWS